MKLALEFIHIKDNIYSAHILPFDTRGVLLRNMNSLCRLDKWAIVWQNERIGGYLLGREDMLFCAGKSGVSFDTIENRKKLQSIEGTKDKAIFETDGCEFSFRTEALAWG